VGNRRNAMSTAVPALRLAREHEQKNLGYQTRASKKWARTDSHRRPNGCEPYFAVFHLYSGVDQTSGMLLQILLNRLIVDVDGTIVDYELKSPFAYLYQLTKSHCSSNDRSKSSTLVAVPALFCCKSHYSKQHKTKRRRNISMDNTDWPWPDSLDALVAAPDNQNSES